VTREVARPGLEPGTPRFSVVEQNLSNNSVIPAIQRVLAPVRPRPDVRKLRSLCVDLGTRVRFGAQSPRACDADRRATGSWRAFNVRVARESGVVFQGGWPSSGCCRTRERGDYDATAPTNGRISLSISPPVGRLETADLGVGGVSSWWRALLLQDRLRHVRRHSCRGTPRVNAGARSRVNGWGQAGWAGRVVSRKRRGLMGVAVGVGVIDAAAPPPVRRGRCVAGQLRVASVLSQSSNRVSPSWASSPGSRLVSVSVVPK
jgi:hypothetical protein